MELMNFSKKDVTMTSLEIAKETGKKHYNVIRDIEKMFINLEIGQLRFEESYYNSQNKKQKMYVLPKDLVLTLLTRYSDKLRYAVIKRLEQLEKELREYKDIRKLGKVTRRRFTDAIKDSGENERMHGHAYSTFTRLIHSVPELKGKKREAMTSGELELSENREYVLVGLLNMGYDYESIKEFLKSVQPRKKLGN